MQSTFWVKKQNFDDSFSFVSWQNTKIWKSCFRFLSSLCFLPAVFLQRGWIQADPAQLWCAECGRVSTRKTPTSSHNWWFNCVLPFCALIADKKHTLTYTNTCTYMHRQCDRWSLHITECVFISAYVNFWVYNSAFMCLYVSLSWCLKSGGLAHLGSPLKVCSCTHTHACTLSLPLSRTHTNTRHLFLLFDL